LVFRRNLMALFAKKNSDSAPQGATGGASKPAKKRLPFGRKKAPEPAPAPVAPVGGVEDFSDFSDFGTETPATATAPVAVAPGKPAKPEKKAIKGGAVVGLNIGNDSIKVVEVKGKGAQVAVTAVGIAPTPPESISNGVVMSTSALSSAIRDLLKTSGISTKRVISSVSGSGALVVRVIEVPQMSDIELKGNMTQDADRYIPFPPSEVIMDFKALRQLPPSPEGNMEVLLAAAQREIVDLHVNVLLGAKLDPQSVDVEPLAAARAMNFDGLSDTPRDVNYGDVSAMINIGATGTEITVLRGDLLVFTRSIPRGGHALTQSISDTLGLAFSDAERLKQDMGDALPPADQSETPTQPDSGNFDDFSDFGEPEVDEPLAPQRMEQPYVAPDVAPATLETAGEDDWNAFSGFGEAEETHPTSSHSTGLNSAPSSGPSTADPFDEGFYNQGPQGGIGQDPTERHAQKQDDENNNRPAFNFSFDQIEESPHDLPESPASTPDSENAPLPSIADAITPPTPAVVTPGDLEVHPPVDIHSAMHPEEMAPSGQMFAFNAVDDPSLPSFPSLPPHLTQMIDDEFASLPTMAEEPAPSIEHDDANLPSEMEAETPEGTVLPAFAAAESGAPTTDDLAALAGVGAPAASPASAFDFDFEMADVVAPVVVPVETPTPENSTLDLDSLGIPDIAPPAAAPIATAPVKATPVDDFTVPDAGPDFNDDFSFDAGVFGARLVGGGISDDITPATIYGIIHPQIEELVAEVRRSLEYFGSRYPDAGVRRITLIGGGAKLRNIDAYFTRELGIPSTRGNPFGGVAVRAAGGSEFIDENAPLFAVALGLALRDVA
jgi:type IV pilus assembly protein PilM